VPYPYAQASHELAVDGSEGLRVAVWNDGLYSTTLAAFTVPGEDVHTLLRDRGAHNPGYGQMVERLTALTGVGWQPGDGADNAHSILAMFGKDGSVELYDARRGDVRLYDLRYDATQGGLLLLEISRPSGKIFPSALHLVLGLFMVMRVSCGDMSGEVCRGEICHLLTESMSSYLLPLMHLVVLAVVGFVPGSVAGLLTALWIVWHSYRLTASHAIV